MLNSKASAADYTTESTNLFNARPGESKVGETPSQGTVFFCGFGLQLSLMAIKDLAPSVNTAVNALVGKYDAFLEMVVL
jgi:hypothetical protein